MPQVNAKGVLWRAASVAAMAGVFSVPQVALAVKVPESVIYDATATDNKKLNHMYSLDGIKYDVYVDSNCSTPAKVAGTTTNAQLTITYTAGADYAESNVVELVPATYWVRENEASVKSKGLAYNKTPYKVTVASTNTEENPAIVNGGPVSDPVVTVAAKIGQKLDEYTEVAEGDGKLSGCVIEVVYWDKALDPNPSTLAGQVSTAKRKWYFKTGADGKVNFSTATMERAGSYPNGQGSWSNSDNPYVANGKRVFLLGTYLIREVAAPEGYDLVSNPKAIQFKMNNNDVSATVATGQIDYETENTPNPGQITISKVDAEAKAGGQGNLTQGDTDHAAIFTIKNNSEHAIKFFSSYQNKTVDGKTIKVGVGEGVDVPVGGEIPVKLKCQKQANGDWKSNTVMLPYGTYVITEDDGGTGMLTDHDWSKTVQLHDQKTVEDIQLEKENNPVRAGLKLTKVDADTTAPAWIFAGGDTSLQQIIQELATGQGNAKLANAEFTIKNVSANKVLVDNVWYDPGQDVAKIVTYVTQTTSGDDIVVANTKSNVSLPYGTYEVRETKAPEGYNPIVGLIGDEAVVVHPEENEHGSWYVTGWEIGEARFD